MTAPWEHRHPEGWRIAPLSTVVRETRARNKGLIEKNLLSLSYGSIVRRDIGSADGLVPASYETYQIVEPGQVVLRMTDLQNDMRSLRSGAVAERGIITSAYIAIEPVGVMPAYLAWLLRGYDHMKVFYSFGGGVRQSLTFADLKRLPTMLPPEGTQRRIADYLDRETATIDALIEKQRQLVDGLHERSEALVRSGVFGQEQGAARADRWIPNLPVGWSIEPLRRHTALVNGSTPNRANPDYWQGGQHAWLNSSHANSDVVVVADQWVTDAAVEECHLPRLCPGTVLVAITGQGKTRGKATLLTIRATINQHLAGILPEARQWDARFLTLMLRAAYDELRLISDAGGSTRGALTLSSLGNVLVARPSLAEQRQIVDHLDRETAKIDALIAKAERFIELAQERRAALITAAVTGQIEIPTED